MLALILLGMAIGYLVIVIVTVHFLSKWIKKPGWRWVFRLVLFALLLFLPVSDQIIGRYYFDHLCETEGGLHVYETVELGPEYYYEDGSPKFIDDRGRFDSSVFNGRYEFKIQSIDDYVKFVVIDKDVYLIMETRTDKILGSFTRFIYRGGWLNNAFSIPRGGISCRKFEGGYYEGFIRHILKPAITK